MDTLTQQQRKRCMARIRSKNTTPELTVRKILTELGFRYRLHKKTLPGKPDIVLGKKRLIIFVNGCFWHQHLGCKRQTLPKTNTDYWQKKLKANVENQEWQIAELNKLKWNTLIIWECETKKPKELREKLLNVINYKNE